MKIKKLSIILSIFYLVACDSSPEEKGLWVLNIDAKKQVNLEDLFDEIQFIDLKMPEDQLLNLSGFAPKMTFTDSDMFIIPNSYDNKQMMVYKFDREGNFINKYDKKGQGPGEFETPNKLLHIDNEIVVISRWSKLLYYDLDMNFLREASFPTEDFKTDFIHIEGSKWLISSDLEDDADYFDAFFELDIESGESKSLGIKSHALATEVVEGRGARFKDEILLNMGFSDTIFRYKDGVSSPFFTLEINGRNLPNEKKKLPSSEEEMMRIINGTYAFNLGSIVATDHQILLQIFALEKTEFNVDDYEEFPMTELYINTATRNYVIAPMINPEEMDGHFSDGEYFYAIVKPETHQYWLESGALGKHTDLLEQTIENMNDPEDPIVIKYKVKV